MLIVERTRQSGHGDEGDLAFEFFGSPEDIHTIQRQISSLGAAAVAGRDIKPAEYRDILLGQLQLPPGVPRAGAEAFLVLDYFSDIFAEERNATLLGELDVVVGDPIATARVNAELEVLGTESGGLFQGGKVSFVDENGLHLWRDYEEVYFSPFEVREGYGNQFSHNQAPIIAELPVTHFTFQHELPPDRVWHPGFRQLEHISVGTLDSEGEYVPFATVLDDRHPAVAGSSGLAGSDYCTL